MSTPAHVLGLGWLAACLSCSPLFAIIDRDANQLSDVWQLKFSTGLLDPNLDADGDGLTNRQESILGLNPLDATSRFNPPVDFSVPGSVSASWNGETGKRYVLETSPDLTTWTAALTLYGSGASLAASADTGSAPRFFVRVKADDIDTDGDGLSDWEEHVAGFNPLRIFSEGIGNTSTNPLNRITDFERVRDLLAGTATHTVTIAAADPAMAENWPDPGAVVIRRTGRLAPVTVTFTLSGTADSGFDYASPVSLSATIPLGADETTISFTALADAFAEGDETIVVTLQPGAGYTLGSATTATLTITDAADGKPAAKAAARFLTQATFGPADAELTRVRDLGFSGWLDDQFTRSPNFHLPIVHVWQSEVGDGTSASAVSTDHRLEAFWRQSMRTDSSSDPLRQRAAFALSQIFVISDRMESLAADQRGMTSYYDTLLENAFGNYRTLLEAVTRNPWMGLYLSAMRNRKANVAANRFPDENYAREVMQLFAIGLWRLNPDGSHLLSNGTDLDPDGAIVPAGQSIPTYGQSQIEVLARVFTGLSYGTRFTSTTNLAEIPTTRFYDSSNVPWRPMRMFDVEHDVAAKTLAFPGLTPLVLPTRTASNPDTGTAGDADLAATLDHLANHPNVGPFISRLLIQRLVTSNPTPAYIGRVSAVFANNGSNVRGDLKAVIKAILLDSEARDPARLDVATHGLVREPYTRYVAAARAFNAAPADPVSSGGRFRGFSSVDGDFLQRPLSAPSVFNFYSPDYRPPGAARDAGLVSPELQITNSVTSISAPNRFSSAFSATNTTLSTTSNSGWTQFNQSTQSDDAATTTVNEATWNTRADEALWLPLATGDPDALVAALDRTLCYGHMSPATFRAITRALRRLDDPMATADLTVRDQRARARLRIAAHL
ncbi:MAG: DUF1800 family protein, partial [Opitutaceae bacterium]|nr:DUF1800 family protein [Opitutaceae bacterium]